MEKDWTGSAIPSVLKGFTLIGQPIKAEEFKNAFGYEMPEIALNEEEKRLATQNNGLEPAARAEPVPKTEQTAMDFGREVLTRIKQGTTQQAEQNKQAQQEQQTQQAQQEQAPPLCKSISVGWATARQKKTKPKLPRRIKTGVARLEFTTLYGKKP